MKQLFYLAIFSVLLGVHPRGLGLYVYEKVRQSNNIPLGIKANSCKTIAQACTKGAIICDGSGVQVKV